MGRIVAEKPGESKPRHPSPHAPIPGPPIYLDARDKDLPYDGYFKHSSPRGPESSYFDQPLGLREEGAMLLAILTGVQGSPLQKLAPGMPGFSLLYGVGQEGSRDSPRHVKGTTTSQALKLDLRVDAVAGLSTNSAMKKHNLQKNREPVDQCVDTMDLEELTAEKEPEGTSKSWLFETAEEEGLQKYTQDLDAKARAVKEITLKEYLALVKKSAGRLGLRTQMLQDLCLAEDVDLGVTDLPAAPPPPPPPKPGANPDKSDDPSKPKPGRDPFVGAMCATSLVVKKARRLAGLMHTEQQTIDLRDIWDWLQHLGAIAPPENRGVDARRADGMAGAKANPEEQKKGDWRLPSSPAMALLYAQEDLRQRLANLYQEKNTLEKRKFQLSAAKKLVGKVGDAEEAKIQNYIHGLQTLEEGYETLGGKIADNLDDAEHLDKRFQTLTEEAKDSKSEKDRKDKKKGKKKGKKGRKGKKSKKTEDDEEDDGKGERQREGSEESDGEGKDGAEEKKGKKKDQPDAEVNALVTEHKSTSPIVSSSEEHGRLVSTMDQASQTDDAALFSLMEKMFNDMEDEAPVGPEDEATELQRLRREVKKLKVQLRFWRSRNWIEKHGHLLSSTLPTFSLPVDGSPSEAGFEFYFDSMKSSIPGLDAARGGHGSAPSNLNGHGIGPVHAKVNSHGGGGPSSAPSAFHWSRPVHPTPSPAPPVEPHVRTTMHSLPHGLRLTQSESQRPSNPLNLRLMANSPPRGSRAARGWSVRPQEPPPIFPPDSLVVFGRSSQLQTPRESTPHQSHSHGSITPRRSGMQHQKA